jgi:hypothetical protein
MIGGQAMKVYRIQDEFGYGLFHNPKTCSGYRPTNLHFARMPAPCEEQGTRKFEGLSREVRRSCRFAFPSKDVLEYWVTPEDMAYLKAWGFDVVELEVEPLMQSENQVIYQLTA